MSMAATTDTEWEMTIREICDEDIERAIFSNDEALIEINKKIESDPENAEYWYEKGFNFFDYEAFEEAIECYDICIDINPNPVDSHRLL